MLTENDVVNSVVVHLQKEGWDIIKTCSTVQRGVDILAEKDGKKLAVEAKGGTSARKGTKRFGKGFSLNQKKTHVAVALLTAAKVSSKGEYEAAIAFPDDNQHLNIIRGIFPALKRLGVTTFVVSENQKVARLFSHDV